MQRLDGFRPDAGVYRRGKVGRPPSLDSASTKRTHLWSSGSSTSRRARRVHRIIHGFVGQADADRTGPRLVAVAGTFFDPLEDAFELFECGGIGCQQAETDRRSLGDSVDAESYAWDSVDLLEQVERYRMVLATERFNGARTPNSERWWSPKGSSVQTISCSGIGSGFLSTTRDTCSSATGAPEGRCA